MSGFTLSAFGDEIDMDLNVQMEVLGSHGIRYIEMRGVDGKGVEKLSSVEAEEIKRRMDDRGFKVSCIGSPIGKVHFADDFAAHLELFRHVLSNARVLDTRFIRLFSFYYPEGSDPSFYKEEVISRLGEMTLLAADADVMLLHENEKHIYGDTPERCLDILEGVASPFLQAIFDPANFLQCGVKTYPKAFRQLKKYIKYLHIKDALIETGSVVPAGYGDGQISEILAELEHEGFEGFLSIEPHLGYFEGLEKLQKDIDIMKIKSGGRESFAVAVNALKALLGGSGCTEVVK